MGKLSGNKGEWSEIYVLFKLLADGCLQGADENLNPDPKVLLKVLKVIRGDIEAIAGKDIIIKSGLAEIKLKRSEMKDKAQRLYKVICVGAETASFSIPELDIFFKKIGCVQVATSHLRKRDISVQVEDPYTGERPLYGFSIKSEVGCPPTLLNATNATNLIYEVDGLSLNSINQINAFDGKQKIIERCRLITENMTGIRFVGFNSETFHSNLQSIDDGLPEIIAHLLLAHYFHGCSTIAGAVSFIREKNPKKYSSLDLYEMKVKRFLRQVALGLTPATVWNDADDATGGYIIVKPDGSLVAFYIYNRRLFDEYLFRNTRFERGSTTRHKFMNLYEEKDENGISRIFIKLNLQIRFV